MFKNIVTILFLIGGFYTLVSLGFWQLDRLKWKEDIIAKIEAQEAIDPMNVSLDLSDNPEFQRGYVEGRFLYDKQSIHIRPRTHEGVVGYHLVTPFKARSGEVVLVNQGWVADVRAEQTLKLSNAGKIAGYLKSPEGKGSFTPINNPSQNLWYWFDMDALELHYGMSLYDKILYLEFPEKMEPMSFQNLPKPRNKHMQYVIFWFGMSGVWLLMALLVYFKRVRNS